RWLEPAQMCSRVPIDLSHKSTVSETLTRYDGILPVWLSLLLKCMCVCGCVCVCVCVCVLVCGCVCVSRVVVCVWCSLSLGWGVLWGGVVCVVGGVFVAVCGGACVCVCVCVCVCDAGELV